MKRYSKILMLIRVLAALGLTACETGVGGTATPTPTPTTSPVATLPVNVIFIIAKEASIFGDFAFINVSSGGTAITTGLIIMVEGEPCANDRSMYSGWVGLSTLTPGTDTTVVITGTGIKILGTICIPEMPAITNPIAAQSDYDSTAYIPISWNAFTQVTNAINNSVDQSFTVLGSDYCCDATSMTITTHMIHALTLKTDTDAIMVQMNVGNIRLLTGASFHGSSML